MRVTLLGLAFGAIVVLGCGGGGSDSTPGPTPSPATQTLTGQLVLSEEHIAEIDFYSSTCRGGGGYQDITVGASVIVRNQAEDVIATGDLGTGQRIGGPPARSVSLLGYTFGSKPCSFPFAVEIPRDFEFLHIGVSHRDGPIYSLQDLEASGWEVGITLGD